MRNAQQFARDTFSRADLNDSDWLDIDEYTALALISAELACLNQGVALPQNTGTLISISTKIPEISRTDKRRLMRQAREDFIVVSGADFLLSQDEYVDKIEYLFHRADVTNNKMLQGSELEYFLLSVSWLSNDSFIEASN